ncbi:MAG: RNA polymerase sigma factor [bacterium]|nr:RNA polymerase sigma factor [bacterium]
MGREDNNNEEKKESLEDDFTAAYDAYADAIFRYCFFKWKNREKAKDMTQETFIRAWKMIASGKEIQNIRALLYRIAHNLIIDEWRKNKKDVSLEVLTDEGFQAADGPSLSPEDKFLYREAIQAVESLPEDYRTVLLMRYVDDLPVKDIADALSESENSVSVRIHRGLKKLKSLMK